MKFLIDAQLPPSLAAHVALKGQVALHVEDIGLRHAADSEVLAWALAESCILVTKDRDFAPSAQSSHPKFQMIWVRTGNVPNSVLFERFDASWTDIMSFLTQGYAVVELR